LPPIRAPSPPNQPSNRASETSDRATQPPNRASQPLNRPLPSLIGEPLPPDRVERRRKKRAWRGRRRRSRSWRRRRLPAMVLNATILDLCEPRLFPLWPCRASAMGLGARAAAANAAPSRVVFRGDATGVEQPAAALVAASAEQPACGSQRPGIEMARSTGDGSPRIRGAACRGACGG
jgi:hypothetical protein